MIVLAVDNQYIVEPDAVFLITTDSREVPSTSSGQEEHHLGYFDRPDVILEYKRQKMIQTPDFSVLDEHSAVGSRLRARAVLEVRISSPSPL